ncbi:hypothetical protein [Hyphococcus luteus]|uniref:Uncharacterized protein n=1 Tax=Hyphococcus luteus TaxID=2058213 RepID=A0A2S7K132_9PROT|nr:hypothetical protein [Marinicaulis flavus]PQA86176.1 hypothetical protein CW354_17620 [Marinicaulis flavus]
MSVITTKHNIQKLISRRSLFVAGGVSTVASALGLHSLLNTRKEQALVTDPDGDEFIYRDGYIIKLN